MDTLFLSFGRVQEATGSHSSYWICGFIGMLKHCWAKAARSLRFWTYSSAGFGAQLYNNSAEIFVPLCCQVDAGKIIHAAFDQVHPGPCNDLIYVDHPSIQTFLEGSFQYLLTGSKKNR